MHYHLRPFVPKVVLDCNHKALRPECTRIPNFCKADKPWMTYCDLTSSNLGAVHHL